MSISVLVLYYSRHGSTRALADEIAAGVMSVADADAMLRTVPELTTVVSTPQPAVPNEGAPFVELEDLQQCDALALGSPTRFGNMAAPLKHFWDATTTQWLNGALVSKPAGVFCSTGSQHGGHESTLLSMMIPLLHHGMVIAGIPYTEPALNQTQHGGGPYGAGHVAHNRGPLERDEIQIARTLGRRLAELATRMNS